MENISTTKDPRTTKQNVVNQSLQDSRSIIQTETSQVYTNLLEEGCEFFYDYLEQIGLSNEPNMILLPSSHHYYYDVEDLKEVKTLVNLKQLNKIKQPKDFLNNIYHILPQHSYFIGYFTDGKNQLGFFPNSSTPQEKTAGIDPFENGISSRIPFLNMIYDIMDAKTNRFLTKKSVTAMLEESGFKILDITEIKGLTYFSVHKGNPITE
jgi:hypothetical protein